MFCSNCSKEIPDGSQVCPECGAVQTASEPAPKAATRKEFFDSVCPQKIRKEIKSAAIVLYICAAATAVVQILGGIFPIDGIIIAALGIWIQTKKSLAGAIIAVVYAVISCVINFIDTGAFGGWLILVGAIIALVYIVKGNKLWKEYKANNGIE